LPSERDLTRDRVAQFPQGFFLGCAVTEKIHFQSAGNELPLFWIDENP
jgi:hypothetical protein